MIETILMVTLPLLIVGGIVTVVLNQQTRRLLAEQDKTLRSQSVSTVVPLIVSALERATLYLDRIRSENLLGRQSPAKLPAKLLYNQLLDDIRTEYEHNAAQQLYISEKAWGALVACRDNALRLVMEAAEGQELEKMSGLELAQRIYNLEQEQTEKPIPLATQLLRRELQRLLQP